VLVTQVCALAGGPVAPATGVPATSVALGVGGFAPLRGGGWLLPVSAGRLIRVDSRGQIDRVIRVGRARRLWLKAPLAPGSRGSALYATARQVAVIAADGAVTKLLGGARRPGFFGSIDGEPAQRASIAGAVGEIADVAATSDGGVLIVGRAAARVAWVAPDRTNRLAVAITRRSLGLVRRRRVAIRMTVPGRVEVRARQRGRVVGRTRTTVPAGETSVPLPSGLRPGEFTLTVKARTRDRRRARSSHRFIYGDRLPLTTARRLSGSDDCRRYTSRRIACTTSYTREISSNEATQYCGIRGIFLASNGVIYERRWGDDVECSDPEAGALDERTPIWQDGTEARPL
jgi:hypothetical protein